MSFFESVKLMPEDSILNMNVIFTADPRTQKVNLGVGTYKTAEGNPNVLACVQKAEKSLFEQRLNKEYLPIDGLKSFVSKSLEQIFGSGSSAISAHKAYGAQSIGGTGALRLGSEFLAREGFKSIFLPNPSWPNHQAVFLKAGLSVESYPYYDAKDQGLDFSGMCKAIQKMPPRSVILLHACCHNPTGIDPTFEQWKEFEKLIAKGKIFPFFDMAYQGFGDGMDEDARAIRYFAEQKHEMLVAISYSKNMGLYGERLGLLAALTQDAESAQRVGSQIKTLIRGNYSNPPLHGARIAAAILQSPALYKEWQQELAEMRLRIQKMRHELVQGLVKQGKDFHFLGKQKGIFSYSGLLPEQVKKLRSDFGIYMLDDGRINIAGLNEGNLKYTLDSILSVL